LGKTKSWFPTFPFGYRNGNAHGKITTWTCTVL